MKRISLLIVAFEMEVIMKKISLSLLIVLVLLCGTAYGEPSRLTLIKAAGDGDLEMVKSLIAKGANVNAKDEDGETALMGAAEKGHLEIVKLLLGKGAKVNAKNEEGVTALMGAAEKGYLEIVRLLLDKGANVNAKRKDGATALYTAYALRHPAFSTASAKLQGKEVVKLLIDKGANVNVQQEDRLTLLMLAVVRNDPEMVKLLLDKGVDVNKRNSTSNGKTALMLAVDREYSEIVKLLLPEGKAKIMEEERLRKQIRNADQCIRNCIAHLNPKESEMTIAVLVCRQQCGEL
jgi:uncharacterized protein